MDKREAFPTKLSLVRYYLKGSAQYFALSMVCAVVVSLLDMLNPRIVSFAVDSVIGGAEPSVPEAVQRMLTAAGGIGTLRERIIRLALIIAAVAFLAGIFRYLFRCLNTYAAEKLVKRMRDKLYLKIQQLPYAWHSANSTGDIIQRCTSDVDTIKVFVSEQLTNLVRIVTLIVLAVLFMAGINVFMAIISSLFIPVVVGYSLFFYGKIGDAFERADVEGGRLSAIAQENLTGVRVVRAFGRESYERDRFDTQNGLYTGFWIRLMKILTINWVTGDIMTGLQLLLVLLMGTICAIRGQITAGQFIAFVAYNSMLIWPVRSLGRVISEMSKAGISIDRLRYIMNEEPEQDPEDAVTPPMDRDICFEHVSFAYKGEEGEPVEVLRDVTFTVKAGTTVGILGGTGSGKTTLMYLLERLYPLPEGGGRITIGGVDIRRIRAGYLRQNIGMVMQEPFLFSRTIAENISIAAADAVPGPAAQGSAARTAELDEQIKRASRIADLEETIESFPKGYETFVGERGVTLSGGQRQRTAIAQMLIRRPPVMIFDDSLSAVDAETDTRIRARLQKSTGDATVILIAHRITTVMHADRIIVLDRGRIREQGTHEELLQQDGFYRAVCELQT